MNTTVWILVFASYGWSASTGPEFGTREKCEAARVSISQVFGSPEVRLRNSVCVKIEK